MFNYSPKIVTDGLVLYLDAANPKSYTSGSTTWRDLTRNGNDGSINNGVGYSSSNLGILTFDGIDDYVRIPTVNLTNTSYTIISSARYLGTLNRRIITSVNSNWLMGWWQGQANKYYAEGWVSNTGGDTAETSWITFAATGNYSQDSWALYRNGNVIVGPNSNGVNGPNGIQIGAWRTDLIEASACHVSYLLVYNRALSATEITQNFNATRGRFGI
jgi:hypothetical protein